MPTKPRKPRKPWRVILGPAEPVETGHTSQRRAYDHLIAELRLAKQSDSPHTEARVMQWEGGRWLHFDTMAADEIPDA